MKIRLIALLLALASPVWAADGDIEGEDSTYTVKPPAALLANGKERIAQITVQRLCDGKGSGGAGLNVTCGPIYLPRGGVPFRVQAIRALSGTSAAGCGYDNWKIYTIQPVNGVCLTSAGNELSLLGVLDDDGTSVPPNGVQQIITIGHAPGPCLYAVGDTTAGTCNSTNTVNIVVDLYP